MKILHRADHITQLADTGGLNEYSVRMELIQHLFQSLAKVTYQTAADTAGIHLGDLNAGILQKTAVNGDFAEFVFNQHKLLACESFLDQLFDQSCLSGSQKTGKNIYFCHDFFFLSLIKLQAEARRTYFNAFFQKLQAPLSRIPSLP